MQELRLLFAKPTSTATVWNVSLTEGDGNPVGAPVPFEPFLTDADYDDLRWYLEEYMDLPDGGAVVRAERVEASLQTWGHRLHDAIFSAAENQVALKTLLAADEPRELTIATSEPALLRLPWELMSDEAGKLALRVSIRRQLDTPEKPVTREVKLPLRILYIVSRPEDAGFIDPRVTTKSLFAALDPLGGSVRLDFCGPPTLARMGEMLREAQKNEDDYDVVHFDGHGTFLPEMQIGALCFEKPDDGSGDSKSDLVPADQLGNLLAQYQIPLVVLEACRSGTVGKSLVFRSVAPRLIQAGVGNVLSMGHAVHVQAATILMDRFYRELVRGTTIGHAVAQGRSALIASSTRWLEYGPGGRTLKLADWFLPHLYQRGSDDPLLPPDLANNDPMRQFDLFLSHRKIEAVRVRELAETLTEKHGLRVWFDEWECGPGKLEPQCEAGIRNSRFTVVACTNSMLDSKWVEWEINKHFELNPNTNDDRLLPLKFEEFDLPPRLVKLLRVDFTDPRKDSENAAKLAAQIRTADAEDARRRRGFRLPARKGHEHGAFPPAPIYGFHGRASELLLLERQFRTHRGIVLHAVGGMGKTTLATEAADWWTRSGLFRSGACFVSFEQFTSAERVVQVLGCYVAGEKFNQLPYAEQRKRVIEYFQQQDVLMVWDNFESTLPQFNDGAAPHGSPYTDEERIRLAELFRDLTTGEGQGRLLVTCRPGEAGLPGAGHYELHGLARADSLWLLAEILKRHGMKLSDPRLTREQLDPLLRDLADHPLSLELVCPHLKTLSPEAIRADFGNLLKEFKQSAPLGPDGKPGKNSSLLASFEFSRRHLRPAAQAALPWLGLFSGGVFEVLLLEVNQITPEAWEPIRRELQSVTIIRAENDLEIGDRPFLRFHPTLASAVATIELAQQPEIRRRFIFAYLEIMKLLHEMLRGAQSRSALHVFDREEDNYRAAVRWAIADGLIREAARLGITFSIYLKTSNRIRERDAWVAMMKEAIQKGVFTEEAADFEREDALNRFQQGDPQGAAGQLQSLIGRLRSTTEFDSAFQLAMAVSDFGSLLNVRGEFNQAITVLKDAVGMWEMLVAKKGGRPWVEMLASDDHRKASLQFQNLAETMGDLAQAIDGAGGGCDEALNMMEKAIEIEIKFGMERGIARGHARCADFLTRAGRYDIADTRYERALADARKSGDRGLEGRVLQNQGSLALKRNRLDRAGTLYRQAIQIFQQADDQPSVMQIYSLLGVVEQIAGRLPEAIAWHEKSRQLAVSFNNMGGVGVSAQNLGNVYRQEGEAARAQGNETAAQLLFQAALRSVEDSLRIWQSFDDKPNEAGSLAQLAIIHIRLNDLAAAEHHAHAARGIGETLGLRDVWKNYSTLVDIAEARDDAAAAADWTRKRDAKLAELKRLAGDGSAK